MAIGRSHARGMRPYAIVVLGLGGGLLFVGSAAVDPRPTQIQTHAPDLIPDQVPAPAAVSVPDAVPVPAQAAATRASVSAASPARAFGSCRPAERAFRPTSVSIPGIVDATSVVALPRDARDVPGVPALTSTGKNQMAFDLGSGVRPGGARGNALLNAHTWPDGSALGNTLLAGLHENDRILVRGESAVLCYKVTERVEVPAKKANARYFAETGQPQIAIVVCSGERLGPGIWTKRTLWFASPIG